MYTEFLGLFLTTALNLQWFNISTKNNSFRDNFNPISVAREDKRRSNLFKDGLFATGPHTMLFICSSNVMGRGPGGVLSF